MCRFHCFFYLSRYVRSSQFEPLVIDSPIHQAQQRNSSANVHFTMWLRNAFIDLSEGRDMRMTGYRGPAGRNKQRRRLKWANLWKNTNA